MYKLGKAIRTWGIVILLCSIPTACTVLTWQGCLKAEGSFFYCLAVLNR